MKKINTFLMMLSVVGLLMLAACSPAAGGNPLTGTSWELTSYGSVSAPQPAAPGVDTSLNFGADGQVGGRLGCNSMGGDYSVSGQNITFGALFMTEMACEEPQMTQESEAIKVLNGTVSFTLTGDMLTITSADGGSTLNFTKIAN